MEKLRPTSRKERRAQERQLASRKVSQSEQNWLKRKVLRPKVIFGLGALSLAVAGASLYLYDRISFEMDVISARAEIGRVDATIGQKIAVLDARLAKNPRLFEPILPDIVKLAVEDFCAGSDCDPKEELGVITLQNEEEYVRLYKTNDGCIGGVSKGVPPAELASNDIVSNLIYLNVDRVKRKHPGNVAGTVYQMVWHEEIHREPKTNQVSDQELKMYNNIDLDQITNPRTRGFQLIAEDLKKSRTNAKCVFYVRNELEEAAVHLLTEDRMLSVGLGNIEAQPYTTYSRKLKTRVVDPYLGKDLKVLREYHKNSNAEGLFMLIGQTRNLSGSEALNYGNAVVYQALIGN